MATVALRSGCCGSTSIPLNSSLSLHDKIPSPLRPGGFLVLQSSVDMVTLADSCRRAHEQMKIRLRRQAAAVMVEPLGPIRSKSFADTTELLSFEMDLRTRIQMIAQKSFHVYTYIYLTTR